MKKILLLFCMALFVFNNDLYAQPINMGSSPITFGNGCAYGQIMDLGGQRKLSLGGWNGCIGPPSGWTTVTVDYWRDRVGIGYTMTSPSYQLQLSKNSAAKPGSAYWTVVSDERLKKDIRPYTKGLSLIDAIEPVYFKYNEASGVVDDSEFVGVIAQDLQDVAPDMVSAIPDPIEKDKDSDYLSVDLSQLDFALVNAVKELNGELKRMQAQVTQLQEDLRQANLQKGASNVAALFVSPNPFQSDIQVKYTLAENTKRAVLEIYTLEGKLVRSENLDVLVNGEVNLSLGQSVAGTLVFKLIADDKVVDAQQIIQVD